MSSYFIALIDVHKPSRLGQYLSGVDHTFQKYDGRFVSAYDNPWSPEGDWLAGRTILIRFPDDEKLLHWYHSKEYQQMARHRQEASVGSMAIISTC